MLRSSDPEDPFIENEVIALVADRFEEIDEADIDVFFEHGQWWARVNLDNHPDRDEITFSVVDCETELGNKYLGLEEIG